MNYADSITLYLCRQNYTEVLESTINNIITWFKLNRLVANSGKRFARMRKSV